ncbi:NfeD family protein [Litorivivens sp.]|uniref:NfeD family protein n=1 Tax=Litorivivens sp. TaxID=2020868 RepID=UPI003562BE24
MEWLDSTIAYWHWLVLGLILIALEIFTAGFVLLWLGISALVVGVLAYFLNLSVSTELLIWTALSVAELFIWFRFIQPRFRDKTLSGMSKEAVVGQVGLVIQANVGERGRLRFSMPLLGSDEWPFICTETLSVGDRVSVTDVSGNTLVVARQG